MIVPKEPSLPSTNDGYLRSLVARLTDLLRAIGTALSKKYSGVYTPTSASLTNLSAVTLYECQYMRVDDVVFVSGAFQADPTTTATATSFEITLPIASSMTAVEQLGGTAANQIISGHSARIKASTSTGNAVVEWYASDTAARTWNFTFGYRVVYG